VLQTSHELCIGWKHTHDYDTDVQRRKEFIDRCIDGHAETGFQVELYYRPELEWRLFLPFDIHLQQTAVHTVQTPVRTTVRAVDKSTGIFTLDYKFPKDTVSIHVPTEFVHSTLSIKQWKPHLIELVSFYKTILYRMDMFLTGTDSQTKHLKRFVDCITSNVAMYKDLMHDFVDINHAVVIAKIRKINDSIHTIEQLLHTKEVGPYQAKHERAKPRPYRVPPAIVAKDDAIPPNQIIENDDTCSIYSSDDDDTCNTGTSATADDDTESVLSSLFSE
jgi:hypothetical protein